MAVEAIVRHAFALCHYNDGSQPEDGQLVAGAPGIAAAYTLISDAVHVSATAVAREAWRTGELPEARRAAIVAHLATRQD